MGEVAIFLAAGIGSRPGVTNMPGVSRFGFGLTKEGGAMVCGSGDAVQKEISGAGPSKRDSVE